MNLSLKDITQNLHATLSQEKRGKERETGKQIEKTEKTEKAEKTEKTEKTQRHKDREATNTGIIFFVELNTPKYI